LVYAVDSLKTQTVDSATTVDYWPRRVTDWKALDLYLVDGFSKAGIRHLPLGQSMGARRDGISLVRRLPANATGSGPNRNGTGSSTAGRGFRHSPWKTDI
jgi:hypothetical protein